MTYLVPALLILLALALANSIDLPDGPTIQEIQLSSGISLHVSGQEGNEALYQQYGRSQKGEDMRSLLHYFWGVRGSTVVESGALDGLRYSNSVIFSQLLQWRAVLIEASPDQFKKLVVNRPEAISVNSALCPNSRKVHWMNTHPPATRGVFEFMDNDSGPKARTLRKLKKIYGQKPNDGYSDSILDKELQIVPCANITSIMTSLNIYKIDLWFLDIEGAEMQALTGWDPSVVKVDVLVIEKNKQSDVTTHMQSIGYSCIDDEKVDKYNYWCSSPTFKAHAQT